MGGEYFDVRMFEAIDAKNWTLIYIPDEPDERDVFYLYSHCGCGAVQLRMAMGYPLFVRPGPGRPDFSLHNVGESMTRTPSLNVLRHDTKIISKYGELTRF